MDPLDQFKQAETTMETKVIVTNAFWPKVIFTSLATMAIPVIAWAVSYGIVTAKVEDNRRDVEKNQESILRLQKETAGLDVIAIQIMTINENLTQLNEKIDNLYDHKQ